MTQDNLNTIAELLQANIKLELKKKRQSRGYFGEPKQGVSAPIASGELYNSVEVGWKGSLEKNDLELQVKMPYYWRWVNDGRKPGRYPPAKPIDRWIITKQGFRDIVRDQQGRLMKRKSLVFLIRRSIGELGYAPTYFFTEAVANTYAEISENIGEGIADWFLSKLEQFYTTSNNNKKK